MASKISKRHLTVAKNLKKKGKLTARRMKSLKKGIVKMGRKTPAFI